MQPRMNISLPRSMSTNIPPLSTSFHNLQQNLSNSLPSQQNPTPTVNALILPNEPMSYDQESDIFDNITLSLLFPGDIKHHMLVKSGETIQEIKRRISVQNGINYTSISLYYNNLSLIDPLSLNDITGLLGGSTAKLEVKISGENIVIAGITTPLSNIVLSEPPPIQGSQPPPNTVILDVNTNIIQTIPKAVENPESPSSQHTTITLPNSYDSPPPLKNSEKETFTSVDTDNKDTAGNDSEAQFNAIKQLGSTNKSRWKLCFLF